MIEAIWAPSKDRADQTLLSRFVESVNQGRGVELSDYDELWSWSIGAPGDFWKSVWDFCGVIAHREPETVLVNAEDLMEARFFSGAKLNYAENLLRRSGPESAIIFHGENGVRRELSWDALRALVSRIQQALRAEGVGAGDRVAGFMPNQPETVAAMLATASLGAVWSSCSPDFGVNGVLDRFAQIEPKVVFTADGYFYNGKSISSLSVARSLSEQLPNRPSFVVVPYDTERLDASADIEKFILMEDFLAPFKAEKPFFVPVDFRHPLFIMFSSGTTGLPKCIVHSVGGTLIQHMKEHQLQCDLKPGDRLFYFTTCGWMMWNWLASALASEAAIVLYDGSPFFPDGNRLADIAEVEKVTHFGTSAKYLDACAKAAIRPAETHDLSALRTILSTGSPLSSEGFDYVYQAWKSDVCLSSIAGGTDIIGCFAGGNPIGPVYRGESQKRHLGMNTRVFDENGRSVEGSPGELVCCSPHPSMPIGFWNDPGNVRYSSAYFERYENTWSHGDWVSLTEHGGMVFHGRSDATLNPGGVRIGTAEIYRQVERISEVLESLVVGKDVEGDVKVVLFVRLRSGVELDEALSSRIKLEIRTHTTPRHVPALVIAVPDIPRTKSGKIVELAVRNVIHGREVRNVHSLANPESLAFYKDIPALFESAS